MISPVTSDRPIQPRRRSPAPARAVARHAEGSADALTASLMAGIATIGLLLAAVAAAALTSF